MGKAKQAPKVAKAKKSATMGKAKQAPKVAKAEKSATEGKEKQVPKKAAKAKVNAKQSALKGNAFIDHLLKLRPSGDCQRTDCKHMMRKIPRHF